MDLHALGVGEAYIWKNCSSFVSGVLSENQVQSFPLSERFTSFHSCEINLGPRCHSPRHVGQLGEFCCILQLHTDSQNNSQRKVLSVCVTCFWKPYSSMLDATKIQFRNAEMLGLFLMETRSLSVSSCRTDVSTGRTRRAACHTARAALSQGGSSLDPSGHTACRLQSEGIISAFLLIPTCFFGRDRHT